MSDFYFYVGHLQSATSANFTGPSAIPITKVGPWDGLGGNHNGATSSAIPPTGLLAHYYHQLVVALGGEHNTNSTPVVESGSSFNSGANNYMGIPPAGVEAVLSQGTSSEMPHQPNQTEIVDGEVHEKYMAFKKFDTVNDHSDHFFSTRVRAVRKVAILKLWSCTHALSSLYLLNSILSLLFFKQPMKAWVKRLQHEWKVLENDLPGKVATVFFMV